MPWLYSLHFVQWSPAVGRVVGYIASNWSLQHNFHNFDAWHVHHSKNAQPMTRATGDNKDRGNAQRNKEQRPYVSNVQLGIRAFHFSRAMKWNESGFRPPLCTYRLNWARRTSWGRWDEWDDTVLQTQDSKFEPWRSEAEHATSRSRRLPTILTFTRGWGRNIFVFFKPPRPGTEPGTLAWKAAVLTTTIGPPPGLWPQYVIMLASPDARGMFVRALASH